MPFAVDMGESYRSNMYNGRYGGGSARVYYK